MWFNCQCGHRINDNSDNLYYKAHLITDEKWWVLWNDVDDAIENSGPTRKDKETACMDLRSRNYSCVVYQCPECGRVHIPNAADDLVSFSPESKSTSKHLFKGTE